MDELYSIGERVAHEHAGFPGAGGGGFAGPSGFAGAGGLDPAALAQALGGDAALQELLGGGGDIEQYLQSYEQMLAQGLQTGPQLNVVDAEGGITVRPEPGFVIKTRDVESGMKVFINVVSNDNIERPHMKSLEELQGEEGCRVPLSVGTPVEDFDKKKEPCITYDIVANPEIVEASVKEPAFRENLVALCLAAIGQKYKCELDQRYKLPKMKYKGETVQVQRIRKSRQSDIQEVSNSNAPLPGESAARRAKGGAGGQLQAATVGPPQPEFRILYSRPDAPRINAFDFTWPHPPDSPEDAALLDQLSGFDLPCYRVNEFQERIRGTMMNKSQREQREAVQADSGSVPVGQVETQSFVAGRLCVVQVRLPELDRQTAALKQFGAEVSDECLRVTFPMLPRAKHTAYSPLTIWWPRPFCSAQATAEWDTESDTLVVSLPTDAPENLQEFDQVLLDAVF